MCCSKYQLKRAADGKQKVKSKDVGLGEWQGLTVTRLGDIEVEDIKICIGSSGMSCRDGRKGKNAVVSAADRKGHM